MFSKYYDLKFITSMIQAPSMFGFFVVVFFFFPRDVLNYQKYLLNSGLWAALTAGFFQFYTSNWRLWGEIGSKRIK